MTAGAPTSSLTREIETVKQAALKSADSYLQVETTAFAITAWLGDPAYTAAVERGMR